VSGGQWPHTSPVTVNGGADPVHGEPYAASDGGEEFHEPLIPRSEAISREIRVIVGSDDPFTRQAICGGANGPGITLLGAGSLAAVVEEMAPELNPDIVLLDVQTTAAEALGAIRQLRACVPSARILACSAPAGNEFGLLCLSAGAWGYVSKEIDLAVLPRLLRGLADGEAVIPRALGTELVKRLVRSTPPGDHHSTPLTPPERRLLELLRTGQTLREAAAEVGIRVATARRHFGSARRKLAAQDASFKTDGSPPTPRQRINSPEVS
jgi:DNA-binding NarL/FixJ family response regulator